jgi:hypothetical protein
MLSVHLSVYPSTFNIFRKGRIFICDIWEFFEICLENTILLKYDKGNGQLDSHTT